MTLTEILGLTGKELDELTYQQKLEFCKPFWSVTRPTEAVLAESLKVQSTKPKPQSAKSLKEANFKRAMDLFEEMTKKLKG